MPSYIACPDITLPIEDDVIIETEVEDDVVIAAAVEDDAMITAPAGPC